MIRRLRKLLTSVYSRRSRVLVHIHIGKCGGRSVHESLHNSPIVKQRFTATHRVHIRRPAYNRKNRYLFVIRNPIDRAISAYNWRYRLVVTEGVQRNRFPGEHAILSRYETIERHALALYDESGNLDEDAARDFRAIHHLRESIAFYLEGCFGIIGSEQVFAVLCQESLDRDIEAYLDYRNDLRIHANRTDTPAERLVLSAPARANLARFLSDDFACLEKLNRLFELRPEAYHAVMQR
jgi:hypothetical protein